MFIEWLDNYPKNRILYPSEFYYIIDQTNLDYYYNQYHEYSSGARKPHPPPTPPLSENKDVDANWGASRPPVHVPPLWSGEENAPSAIDDTLNELINELRNGDLFTTFRIFEYSTPDKIDGEELNDTAIPSSASRPSPLSEPDIHPHVCVPPKSKTEYKHIDDPVDTIADLISIIDKYDADGEYNIDVRQLSNIREELVELNGMVGMKKLKQSVQHQLIYFIQGLHLVDTVSGEGDFKHTVIYGPPGTGKTEIAKIIGRMYSKLGILKNNVFKKATRNDLVAGYLGQTAIKTKALIRDCLGGVLFIDEAYSLSNSNDLDSFSKECIDTLCESLSDHKDDLMVIIAGYENELENHFFNANPGLDSRFIWRFKIDSYTPHDLTDIFRTKILESGWDVEGPDVVESRWFEKHKKTFVHFGRDMEILFFYTKIQHSKRVFGKPAEIQRILIREDLEKGFELFMENAKRSDDKFRSMMESLYI